MARTVTIDPASLAVQKPLKDILPEVKPRPGFTGFVLRHPTIVIGIALLAVMILLAIFAPYVGTQDPAQLSTSKRMASPSAQFWFGTDMFGRDVYSRVIYGARVSLLVGLSVAILSTAVGLLIGLVSGFIRPLDAILMRIMDGVMSIPSILLAIALMALTRGSVGNVIIAITVAEFPRVARLVRGLVLGLREQPFIEAAIAAGSATWKLIYRHVLPNTVAPLIVQATYICAAAMIVEAVLSFIGAGTPPTTPSWGNIMSEGRAIWQIKFTVVLFPAIFLSITVLAVNLLGDGLRDALDPRNPSGQ